MDLGLEGKVALVTGASRGIGAAIAAELALEGCRLALVSRTPPAYDGGLVLTKDLRDPEAPGQAVAQTVAHYGGLDLVVNSAGATVRGDFLELTDEQWADGYALKLFGAMRLTRAAWPHLVAAQGAVVNVVGIGGRTGSAEFTIGGSVNAALLNLTKALADRGDGVRVNAVNPGSIATERLTTRVRALAEREGVDEATARQRMSDAAGVPRFGEPAEIARVVAFVASPAASYLQGSVVDVDGGATRTL